MAAQMAASGRAQLSPIVKAARSLADGGAGQVREPRRIGERSPDRTTLGRRADRAGLFRPPNRATSPSRRWLPARPQRSQSMRTMSKGNWPSKREPFRAKAELKPKQLVGRWQAVCVEGQPQVSTAHCSSAEVQHKPPYGVRLAQRNGIELAPLGEPELCSIIFDDFFLRLDHLLADRRVNDHQ
jgi:hypothetical protein